MGRYAPQSGLRPAAAAEPVSGAVAADGTEGAGQSGPRPVAGHGSVPTPGGEPRPEAEGTYGRVPAPESAPLPAPTRAPAPAAPPATDEPSSPGAAQGAALPDATEVPPLAPEFAPRASALDAAREESPLAPASAPEPAPGADATRELRLRLPAEPAGESGPDATRELRLRPLPGPDTPPAPPAPPAPSFQLPPPPMPLAPPVVPPQAVGEEALPVDMRKRLSLRKQQVAVSLHKHGAQGVVARILLVLDASGSMAKMYERGVVADVVERMAAVAAQLDDDGTMQAWTFATRPARLPDLSLPGLPDWLRLHVRPGELSMSLFGRRRLRPPSPDGRVDMKAVGIQNEEQKVIAEVRAFVHAYPSPLPTLVLFFSDGGIYRNSDIEAQLRAAADEPIFWQFVGLGRSNYGVLERFDSLPGRRVDNVGFFSVDDISTLPDPELYDRLLSEFPQWIAAARREGILRQG
ncbi:VWA domain-containing protein [Kitasatospora sp. NPDC004531]